MNQKKIIECEGKWYVRRGWFPWTFRFLSTDSSYWWRNLDDVLKYAGHKTKGDALASIEVGKKLWRMFP